MKTKKLIFFIFMTAILLLGLGVISATNSTEYGQVDTVKQTPQNEYKEVNKIDKKSNERLENVKTATKPETQVKLTPQTLNKQKNITIPVTVTTKSNAKVKDGRVSLYLNNNLLGSNALINGQRNMTITKLDPGTYTVKVTYNSDNYQPSSNTTTLKIDMINTTLSLKSQTVFENEKITVPVAVKDSAGAYVKDGRVSLYLNNKLLGSNALVNGQRNMLIDKQWAGTYTLEAVYNSENYKTSTKTVTLTVCTQPTTLTMTSQYGYDDSSITIPVSVKDSTGAYVRDGRVSLYLNNKLLGSNALVNGQRNMIIGKQKAGTYTLKAVYNSTNYKTSSKTATLTVYQSIKPDAYVYINSQTVNVNTKITIPVTVKDNVGKYIHGGRVTLTCDGKVLGSNAVNNGKANMQINSLTAGTHNIRVDYSNTNYEPDYDTATITVNKISTSLTLDTIEDVYIRETIYLSGRLVDNKGNGIKNTKITFNVNGATYSNTTDSYGYYDLKYKTSKVGTNTVTASYAGNANYMSSSVKKTFTVTNPYKTFEISLSKGKTTKRQIGTDMFYAWYQTYDAQYDKGVHVDVSSIYATDMGDPTEFTITDALFYFKNSRGDVITRSYTSGAGIWITTKLVSGYTPYKVKVTYKETTWDDLEYKDYGYWWSSKTNSWVEMYKGY